MTLTMLSRDNILAQRGKLRTDVVEVPEWGGSVIVLEMSGTQRDQFEADIVTHGKNGNTSMNLKNIRAKLVARTVVDPSDFDVMQQEDGSIIATLKPGSKPHRMFTDLEVHDLGELSASALHRVFMASQVLSGITEADVKELVGELKNDQNGDSGFD